MCGIAGFFNKSKTENTTHEISAMLHLQKHRGPDDLGIVGVKLKAGKCVHLRPNEAIGDACDAMIGFVRLSIRDLTDAGHQPMLSNDGKVVLTFNGEIYNADVLRKDLMQKGEVFVSTTDTEVILHLYRKHGLVKTVRMLNGMFAISILDLRIGKAFLIRDRVGIKPLYYTVTQERFAYASEIKCFLEMSGFKPELSYENLLENFTFYKPLNNVLLKDVHEVRPGEYVVFDTVTHDLHTERYFSLDVYERPTECPYSQDRLKEMARETLFRCVEDQKISDVKVGCQLSGGVDSSLVTYFASMPGDDPLQDSISVIFDGEEKGYSEEMYMRQAGQVCNVDIHETVMNVDYVLENYERTLWHGDTVIGRPNSIGLLMLTEKAKEFVTVLVSGEGADELMGGYDMFKRALEVEDALREKSEYAIATVKGQPELVHNFAEYAVISQQKTNRTLCREILPGYYEKELIDSRIDMFHSFAGTNFDKQIKYAMTTYLPELLLCQDKMSMANSIENRVPMLDNEMIDFAFSIPQSYLICDVGRVKQGKYLLKEICADVFGKDFACRRKMGFGLPYYRYFMDKRFRAYFYESIVPGTRERGILNADTLINWYENLGRKPWGECELFWKACSLEAWCQMFLDRRAPIGIV